MKKITFLLMLLVSYTGFAQFPAPYCGPIDFTTNVEPITLVNFAGINNATLETLNGSPDHEDFTSISGAVIAGSSYTITLKGNTDGGFTNRFMVFADWNQDGDFADANEAYTITQTIFGSTGIDAVQATQVLDIPPTALAGSTRLRVKKIFGTTNYTDPCLGTAYGQVEDYSLTVSPPPADLPDSANLQSPLTASIAAGGSVTVYGRVYELGLTDTTTGQAAGIQGWVGISPVGSDTNPNTWTNWTAATFNVDAGNDDEYQATIGAALTTSGTYYYATRFRLNGGAYVYGGTNGIWNGTTNVSGVLTVTPPTNDECSGAIALTVNPDYACGTVTQGTVLGASASSVDATACGGSEDDDVWFSFVATSTSHKISLLNVAGSVTDMYHSLWTGACNSLTLVPGSCSDADTSNPSGLTIGQTYYVRVNTFTATAGQTSTFNICIGTPPPPPVNDECSGAVALTVNPNYSCGTVTPGTIAGATASSTDTTACGGTEDDDVWFSFVATSTTHRISILNTAGSTTDMYHSLWTGADCSSLTLVAGSCSDADVSNRTGLTVGQTYYVRVYTWTGTGGQTSTFNICIGTPPPPPTNDNFATPIAVTCGNVYTGDTSSQVTLDEDNAPDGFGADLDAPNLWYSFTGTGAAQTVTVNLCGSAYDTSVLVYTGTSGNLTLVAANDDDNTCVSNTLNSSTSFTSDGTTTYYITVEGYNVGSVGAFTMNVTCAAVNPPAVSNQDCGTALNVQVDGSDNNSDNSFGTVNSTQPTCDTFGSIQDVWFSFVAPASGSVTALLTPGTMTSLNYAVYSGACGALTAVGNCNSNLTVANTQQFTTLTPGQTYYVQVWSNAAEQGTFVLRLTDDGLGNGSFDSSNFSYFPNPVKSVLNLSYSQDISNVEVYNLLGQKMSADTIGANLGQVDMSDLASGTYLVKVTAANNQSKTIRVIKE